MWQRGLSLYYAERLQEGSAQFRRDVAVNPNDTEEAVWAFLCEARDPRVRRAKAAQVARDAADGVEEDTRYVKYSWKRALDMLYFSISNTVTLGYGDIYPISPKSKLLVIGQILAVFAVLCVK